MGCSCLGMQWLLAESPTVPSWDAEGAGCWQGIPMLLSPNLRLLALLQALWSLTSPSQPPWHRRLLGSLAEVAAVRDIAACLQPPLLIEGRSARGQQDRRLRVLEPSCEALKAAPHKHQGADWPVAQFRWFLSPMQEQNTSGNRAVMLCKTCTQPLHTAGSPLANCPVAGAEATPCILNEASL